jgi:formylglycine-generating enzyme required for sulfatase activity
MKPTDTTPDGIRRKIRGGSWDYPVIVRPAARNFRTPELRFSGYLGFRTHLPVRQPRV